MSWGIRRHPARVGGTDPGRRRHRIRRAGTLLATTECLFTQPQRARTGGAGTTFAGYCWASTAFCGYGTATWTATIPTVTSIHWPVFAIRTHRLSGAAPIPPTRISNRCKPWPRNCAPSAADGEPYRLIELPLPAARHDETGRRLPAGYANFLILNGVVLVPLYGDRWIRWRWQRCKAASPTGRWKDCLRGADPPIRQPALRDHAATGRCLIVRRMKRTSWWTTAALARGL